MTTRRARSPSVLTGLARQNLTQEPSGSAPTRGEEASSSRTRRLTAPLVVFAVGNPSRGDDALGPQLLARLGEWLEAEGRAGEVELVEDFQLQVEHALDLEGRELALFIDAGTGTPAPYSFRKLAPAAGYGHTTHALAPEAVLQVFIQTVGGEPPPAFLLCVRGESYELGEGLSPAAAANLEAAMGLLNSLVRNPAAGAWAGFAESPQR